MKNFILKNWSLFLVLSYVILVSAYALLNGTSSIWFQIHDNLDSNVVWYKMLRDNEGFLILRQSFLFLAAQFTHLALSHP